MKRAAKFTLTTVLRMILVIVWIWTLAAFYFLLDGSRTVAGPILALSFVLATGYVLLRQSGYAVWWVVGAWVVALGWFVAVKPSNDRDWRVEVAREPVVVSMSATSTGRTT